MARAAQDKAAVRTWHSETVDRRVQLKVEPDHRPWTSRGLEGMKGLRPQAKGLNFLHEGLDLRWVQDCDRVGRPHDSLDVPTNLVCDIRQAWHHQCAGPEMVIVTNSVSFHHWSKRTMAPFELVMQQGWPRSVINLSEFEHIPEGFPWSLIGSGRSLKNRREKPAADSQAADGEVEEPPLKKCKKPRKPKMQAVRVAVTELAGNGMVLPDNARYAYSSLLACPDPTLFEFPCDDRILEDLASRYDQDPQRVLWFNPEVDDPRVLRKAMEKEQGGYIPSGPVADPEL